jgi:hypothetical protein
LGQEAWGATRVRGGIAVGRIVMVLGRMRGYRVRGALARIGRGGGIAVYPGRFRTMRHLRPLNPFCGGIVP